MGFRYVHICTNDYPYLLNGFSLCTFLYAWLSISLWMVFRDKHCCTDDYLLILNKFPSCPFLSGWLPSNFVCIFVMCIRVRITTNSFWQDCRHLHFCTYDINLIMKVLLSRTFLYEWLPFHFELVFVMHILWKTFPILFEWIVVMYITGRMSTISFWMDCLHASFCGNEYHFFFWMDFHHPLYCANDYHFFLNWFSKYTFLCEWLRLGWI